MRTILYALHLPEESADGLVRIEWHCPPATPDEIKAAHPKCGGCEYFALNPSHFDGDICERTDDYVSPTKDYCRHHQPKEQQ